MTLTGGGKPAEAAANRDTAGQAIQQEYHAVAADDNAGHSLDAEAEPEGGHPLRFCLREG